MRSHVESLVDLVPTAAMAEACAVTGRRQHHRPARRARGHGDDAEVSWPRQGVAPRWAVHRRRDAGSVARLRFATDPGVESTR